MRGRKKKGGRRKRLWRLHDARNNEVKFPGGEWKGEWKGEQKGEQKGERMISRYYRLMIERLMVIGTVMIKKNR